MKEKGFTLIELLAVIVILAIIALIAVPIILNIIEDAKKESDERSVELYASAVKNGIAKHQLTGSEVPTGTYNESNPLPFEVEYDGSRVECEATEIYADGNIYLEGCTVNGGSEKYPYGTKKEKESTQVYKPQYYSWSYGFIGEDLPSDATENASDIGKTYYLGHDVEPDEEGNNIVTAAYACFIRNNQEYCLKGGDGGASYETNKSILEEAFSDVEDACSFEVDRSRCNADGLVAFASSDGYVNAYAGDVRCFVYSDANFQCFG